MNVAAANRLPAAKLSTPSSTAVLIAEDDPIFRHVVRTWLQNWGYEVVVAENGLRAWELLQKEDAPQLVVLDWVMPGIDGLELCRKLRERPCPCYHYVLLLTSRDNKQDIVRGLEAGADDYLTKPFDPGEMNARLRVGKRILKLQEDLIQAREDLRFRATHDGLTGLWNRVAILDLLHRELQRAAREQTSTGLLMIDLDHFKKINDTCGHLAGDLVLQKVAQRITDVVRSYDFLGRYGGEEFLVVLSHCAARDLRGSAERIRHAVADTSIAVEGMSIALTVSVGAAAATPGSTAEERLLAGADAALYRAKKAGRNRVELSEGEGTEES